MGAITKVSCAAIAFTGCEIMLAQAIGFTSPWLMLLLMFYLMALAKLAEPLFVLRLPVPFRAIRQWEKSGNIYRWLAVHRFGMILRSSPLRRLNPDVYVDSMDLQSLHRRIASGEAIHFWAAVLFTPYIAFVYLIGQTQVASIFLLLQFLVNIYPILHLRFVRQRLEILLMRRQVQAARGSW
ncbi:hypothetical protein GM658_28120 [Pseudoduganella eburnea]|uniref:Glycosyl-4,4'-diaponeurosporenoate acyltransferase n=1 Tax=Massilia eburnea TaxID=1776165 RepID=A0A6L6QRI3_9BURK|nr:hypothetical protein [Massilia eburnea]MTW14487.1 hypothetical protein [Massilia eburnea]